MTQNQINTIKKSLFLAYSNSNTFVNLRTGVQIVGEPSFALGNFYISGKRENISEIAIVLKEYNRISDEDLAVLTSFNYSFTTIKELSLYLKAHIVFKESVLFVDLLRNLNIAIPFLNVSVVDLLKHEIIVYE